MSLKITLPNKDFHFNFYNNKDSVVCIVTLNDIDSVNWNKQCYYLSENIIQSIRTKNVLHGAVKLFFCGKELLSIKMTSPLTEEQYPKGAILFTQVDGQYRENFIIVEEHSGLRPVYNNICNNKKLYRYLRKHKKI